MGFEIEIKFRVDDLSALAGRLVARGAIPGPDEATVDHYLAHPARDFAQTDEALRIRRVGDENRVTYKGPKRGGPTKTREEIELPFGQGEESFAQMETLFQRLGFRPVATTAKVRTSYRIVVAGRRLDVCLDLAEGLGIFAEVETLVEDAEDLPAAQAAVLDLAGSLGLTELEPKSYLRMTLERAAGKTSGD